MNASYTDLFNILKQTRKLVATANAGTDDKYTTESLRLQDDRLTVTLPSGFSADDLDGAPEVTYDAYYIYSHSKAPISDVTIRLGDGSR